MSNISDTKETDLITTDDYALKITGAWNRATQAILETAYYLVESEKHLSKTEYRNLKRSLEDNGVMSASTISKIRRIGSNSILMNKAYVNVLPPHTETLYSLSDEKYEDTLEGKIIAGQITSELQQKDITDIFGLKPSTTVTTPNQKPFSIRGDLKQLSDIDYKSLRTILIKLKSKYDLNITGIDLN